MIAHSSLSYSLLFSEMEAFSTSMSKAASLSYTAGIADFDSVNNFSKEDFTKKEDSNLEQARRAIVEAKTSLDKMLIMMEWAEGLCVYPTVQYATTLETQYCTV